jgi:hypothetical protein
VLAGLHVLEDGLEEAGAGWQDQPVGFDALVLHEGRKKEEMFKRWPLSKIYWMHINNTQGYPRFNIRRQCFFPGLWIRIDSIRIRIRIQHISSIRIRIQFRIQAKTELLKTIFCITFVCPKSSAIFYLFSDNFFLILHHWNFWTFLPLDPDPGSGFPKSLNPDQPPWFFPDLTFWLCWSDIILQGKRYR